jgi:hypothetical protein
MTGMAKSGNGKGDGVIELNLKKESHAPLLSKSSLIAVTMDCDIRAMRREFFHLRSSNYIPMRLLCCRTAMRERKRTNFFWRNYANRFQTFGKLALRAIFLFQRSLMAAPPVKIARRHERTGASPKPRGSAASGERRI